MNKDIIKGNWHEAKGKIMQTWARITKDEVLRMKGNSEELAGLLEKKYGYDRDRADKEISNFAKEHDLK